jgi:hypothetical protein
MEIIFMFKLFLFFQLSSGKEITDDNLYLGIVLAAVVVLTGIFSYYQVRNLVLIIYKILNSQKKTFIYFFEILRHFFSF